MGKTKNRIFYFDELRALAILFVIMVHVSKWFRFAEIRYTLDWCFSVAMCGLGNLGVPLFLMLSGALILNRKFEFESFYKKRLSRLLIPFGFWLIIYLIFKVILMNYVLSLNNVFKLIFSGGFVWYVWLMVGIYLIYPVINSFIEDYSLRGCEYFLVIWFASIVLWNINLYPLGSFNLKYFTGYLGYFVLGYYLRNKDFKLSNKQMMIASVIIFLISFILYEYCIYYDVFIPIKRYCCIFLVTEATSLFLFFKNWEELSIVEESKIFNFIKDSAIGKMIFSVSLCSYGMYLTHYFPIWIAMIMDKTTPIFIRNPFKWIPFMILICFLFSWGLTYALSKIPYLKEFSGV